MYSRAGAHTTAGWRAVQFTIGEDADADERGKNPDLYPFNPRLCFYLFVNIQCEARGLAPIK